MQINGSLRSIATNIKFCVENLGEKLHAVAVALEADWLSCFILLHYADILD